MSRLLHDERIPAALLTIVMHITVVSAIAMVAASLARRHAAFRHTILCTAMLCLLAGPLFCAFGAWSGLSMEIPLAVNPGQSTNGMSKVDTAARCGRQ
jgi:uncharacterized membrane protein